MGDEVTFRCPECRAQFSTQAELGRRLRCTCGHRFILSLGLVHSTVAQSGDSVVGSGGRTQVMPPPAAGPAQFPRPVVGGCRLLEKLGVGNAGAVYLA